LAAAFPDDRFLGEETAPDFAGPFDRSWVVDPIDGTHNFLRGMPYWNVAIAYVENARAQIGVVFDPTQNELYHAIRGGGAWCDSRTGAGRGSGWLHGTVLAVTSDGKSCVPRLRTRHRGRLPRLDRRWTSREVNDSAIASTRTRRDRRARRP